MFSRRYTFAFILAVIALYASAQRAADSLTTLLSRPGLPDTARVDVLNKLAWELKHKRPDQSLRYGLEALALAQQAAYLRGEGEAYNQIGINHSIMGNYLEGLENFLKALPMLEQAGAVSLTANTMNNIGNSHQLRGNMEEARRFFRRGLQLRLDLPDTPAALASYNSLAILFKEQLEFDSARHYFGIFLKIAEHRKDSSRMSVALNNLGLVHRNMKHHDSALFFFRKALAIKQHMNDEKGIALSYRNIGDVYNEQGEVAPALKYYQQALAIRDRIGYNFGRTILLKDIALMLKEQGRFDEALVYVRKSLAVARAGKMKPEEASALHTLSQILEQAGDMRGALRYHKAWVALKDSLFNAEKSRQLNELQVKYASEQKEKTLLSQTKTIATLELQRAGEKHTMIYLLAGTGFLACMLVLLYSRYRIKKRSEEAASTKNQIITRKNEEIERMNRELEKRMLRAQMDPHFIFNCLNSIQHFIAVSDKDSALKYLSSFASLVRQVLENSVNTIVPLADELRLLKLYIELETLRFEHRFQHAIEVDPGLDLQNTEIPFLLIQPYVENAIQHGLRHRPAGGKLLIRLARSSGYILCTVEDNGIGRARAGEMKEGGQMTHRPRGMSLARQRLVLLNKRHSRKTLVNVEDLGDTTHASGTKVTITIPSSYDD